MTLEIQIDELACCGHGDCALIAPDVFVVDDVARVVGSGPDEVLRRAAEACPAAAIVLAEPGAGR